MENILSELKNLKEDAEGYDSKLNENNSRLAELEKVKEVQEYIKLKAYGEELTQTQNRIIERTKEIGVMVCDHDLWVLLSMDYDDHEMRKYWTCKCLNCGKIHEDRAQKVSNILFKPENVSPGHFYLNVRAEYKSLIDNEGLSKEEAELVLVNRYRNNLTEVNFGRKL